MEEFKEKMRAALEQAIESRKCYGAKCTNDYDRQYIGGKIDGLHLAVEILKELR